ncbi:MAG: suppressor of fused domain protein [Bacteroidota bacterium]
MIPTKSELFVQYLIDTLGDYSSIVGIETQDQELGMVLGIIYHNYPEHGLTTGFTYGLSAASHPEWKTNKPELSITVASSEDDWVMAVAQLVEWHRTNHPFTLGSLFHFGKSIATDSLMDSFLVYNLAIDNATDSNRNPFQAIPLEEDTIQIYGVYPLYTNEVELIKKIGIRKFTGLREYELFSVHRDDLSQLYQVG